jgi:hypothetical protein
MSNFHKSIIILQVTLKRIAYHETTGIQKIITKSVFLQKLFSPKVVKMIKIYGNLQAPLLNEKIFLISFNVTKKCTVFLSVVTPINKQICFTQQASILLLNSAVAIKFYIGWLLHASRLQLNSKRYATWRAGGIE